MNTKTREWLKWFADLFGVWWTLVWVILGGMIFFGASGVLYLLTIVLTAVMIAMAIYQHLVVEWFNRALSGLKTWWKNKPK